MSCPTFRRSNRCRRSGSRQAVGFGAEPPRAPAQSLRRRSAYEYGPERASILISRRHVAGQSVPEAAQAGDQMSTVAKRPDGESSRKEDGVDDAMDKQAWTDWSVLIQAEIKHVADVIIASYR